MSISINIVFVLMDDISTLQSQRGLKGSIDHGLIIDQSMVWRLWHAGGATWKGSTVSAGFILWGTWTWACSDRVLTSILSDSITVRPQINFTGRNWCFYTKKEQTKHLQEAWRKKNLSQTEFVMLLLIQQLTNGVILKWSLVYCVCKPWCLMPITSFINGK